MDITNDLIPKSLLFGSLYWTVVYKILGLDGTFLLRVIIGTGHTLYLNG